MWSPDSRKERARTLSILAEKLARYRQLAARFSSYFPADSDNARLLAQLLARLEGLQARAQDRQKRLAKGVVKIGVVGLEKQGKSAFLSAWLRSERLLPSEAERCTWSTTVVEPSVGGELSATITFYAEDEFKERIRSYFDALEEGSVSRWSVLDGAELARLRASFKQRVGYEVDDPDRAGRKEQTAFVELTEIAAGLKDVRARLGQPELVLKTQSLDELATQIRPFIALKDTQGGNRPYPGVRAVKLVTVRIPVEGAMPGVVLMDLPGIDAPSDKARRDTEEAMANEVDVTLFVKDITRPSLVRGELELLRAAQTADRSISLRDRMFVVLTKVDLFDKPDENGSWAWQLATRNFREQGIDRIFPYSQPWANQGVDEAHPVAKQLMQHYGSATPVSGLDQLKTAVFRYLSTEVDALDQRTTTEVSSEFAEVETQLRGALVSVKDALSDREFERRAEQVFDELFEHIRAGEDPVGLLPEMRKRLSAFLDREMSEAERHARASKADERIAGIKRDLLARLTPDEAEAKRRQMPSPGLMNETAVEIEMRKQMRERVAARIAGLGEDFRNTARESVEKMLGEMFSGASYDGGRLDVLLPPGPAVVARIDALGRSGHVSESVVRYQNQEMAKADVAFEVLSRYFARQIVDILDATDPGDRDFREREMAGLEQFFGMTIADKAQPQGVVDRVKSKIGLGADDEKKEEKKDEKKPATFAFPKVEASFPSGKKDEKKDDEPAAPPGAPRDWSKMLARVRADVDRIVSFLEALAKHPRGLQKYHEEAVRTVHDSWLDREGEQSLRRWVRSECRRVWPHRFAAIFAERDRARDDIAALEELFRGA